MRVKRPLCLILSLCLVLSVFFTVPVSGALAEIADTQAVVDAAPTSANPYGLADSIQQGQILHCWNWSYANIEANLQKIAQQGFSAIQTSPIQPIKESTTNSWNTVLNSSWVVYQPVAFSIEDNYRNVQGTKAEFISMCEKAHNFGIKVICDIVFNHMANDMSDNTIHPWIPSEIKDDTSCWHNITMNISDYDNRYQATQYCLTGLPDLNTANSTVQEHCTNLLKEAIDAGADGFRFDAAKHIETPSDNSSYRSDFWPNVLDEATSYAQSTRGFTPYYYGEVLGSPGGSLSITAYTKYMNVTDSGMSDTVRNGVCNGDAAQAVTGGTGNGASESKVVQWTESHDNHKDNGTNLISDNNINKTWAITGSKAENGALYLARPENMETTMMGDADQTSWTYPEVRAVNRFRNAFAGQSEYLSSYYNLACVERGTSGMVIVNTGGSYYNGMSAPVYTMATGTYKDVITGNTFTVSNGKISGDIGDTGIAVIYNEEDYSTFTTGELTDFAVVGSMNNWDTSANIMVAQSGETASTTMFLSAGTYTFKVSANGIWYGNSGTITDTTGEAGWTMRAAVTNNCTLKATGGKYTFTFNVSTGKLVIDYESTADRTSDVYLRGTFNDWESTTPLIYEEGVNTVSAEVFLEAGTYTFKLNDSSNGAWYSNSGTISNETDETGWTMRTSVADDCTITVAGGTYRFAFNLSTMKLVVEQLADLTGVVKYTVTFVDWDSTVLSTQEVEKGTAAVPPADPTRAATAHYTYTFAGWNKDYSNITASTTVTAVYTQTVNKYTVTFVDYDGTVIEAQQVEYGSAAVAPTDPVRDGYTFTGWDKSYSSITGDTVITALYSDNSTYLKGSFNSWSESNPLVATSDSNIVSVSIHLTAGEYTFKIHSKEVWYGNSGTIEDTTEATSSVGWTMKTGASNCTLVATGGLYTFNFNLSTKKLIILHSVPTYTVTFLGMDGEELDSQVVGYGEPATAPEVPEIAGYSFTGWDKDFTNITEHTVVTALYKYVETFAVTWEESPYYTVESDAEATAVEKGGAFDFSVKVAQGYKLDAVVVQMKTLPSVDGVYTITDINSDTKVIIIVTKDVVESEIMTFEVVFTDRDGNVLSTQNVKYGVDAIAPVAPEIEGYTFTGWDTDYTYVTKDITVKATYKKEAAAVVPATTGNLKIEVTGGAGFTISVNEGTVRPQGTSYMNTKAPIGATVTVVSNGSNSFVGWMNESGAIVSETEEYTFTTSGNDTLKAVYMTEVEGVNAVVFKNGKAAGGKGQVIDMQYYASGDVLVLPDAPTQAGYEFTGWSMTAEEIEAKLAAGEDVEIVANWEAAKIYINVTVTGGTISTEAQSNGQYLAYNSLEVVAGEAEEGKKFAYWTDASGNIMSYDAEYKFFPATDTELIAVYVAEDEEVEYKPLVFIAADPTTSGEKITYTLSWDVDSTIGVVTSAGLMVVNKNDYNEDTFYHGTTDTNVFDRALGASATLQQNTYSIGKSSSYYDNTYVACTFVVYTDATTGESVTVYSELIEVYKSAP